MHKAYLVDENESLESRNDELSCEIEELKGEAFD